MGDDLLICEETDRSEVLPDVSNQPLTDLLASSDNALARTIRRLASAPEAYAAFDSVPHSPEH